MPNWNKKRWEVLIDILKDKEHSIGAEIGVLKGVATKQLLDNLPNLENLFLVDPWKGDEEYLKSLDDKRFVFRKNFEGFEALYQQVSSMINKNYSNRATILRMTSMEASKNVEDGKLDWYFIDADHSYEHCKQDIELWTPKVKVGGWLMGHDYSDDCWDKIGVVKAVDEIFGEVGFEVEDSVWYLQKQ